MEHQTIQHPLPGPAGVATHPASLEDAVAGVPALAVIEPAEVGEVARTLAWANEHGVAVFPRGGGARLGWGWPPARPGVVVTTCHLTALHEHAWADLTVTVAAGMTLAELQRALAERQQFLPLDPPWPERTTIGGLIASDDSGPLRLRYGGVRDLLLGVTFVRADGVVARGGGKVVKNVAGYDLPKLLTGSLGTLGLITSATFRLHPLPPSDLTLRYDTPTPAELLRQGLRSPVRPAAASAVLRPAESFAIFRLLGSPARVQHEQAQLVNALGTPSERREGDTSAACWRALTELPWQGGAPALVARLSVLPSEVPTLARLLRESGLVVAAVIHGHGLAFVRLAGEPAQLASTVATLRSTLAAQDGSLVVLELPPSLRSQLDPWNLPSGLLPLVARLRAQFDPRGVLNPGRLVPLEERR
ncbi:MAG: FAD-binding oxidoreductase [Chloroflexi bacterium]|nr:FAD-binding oxidoreductase [Chloroflexota bacterium]